MYSIIDTISYMPPKKNNTKASPVELAPETSDSEIEITKEVATIPKQSAKKAKEEPKVEETKVEEPKVEEDPLQDLIDQLHEISNKQKELNKEFETKLKALDGMKKNLKAKKKIERKEYPKTISKELAKFLGLKEGAEVLKSEVTKRISDYVKERQLNYEDEDGHKNNFKLDKPLKSLFDDKIKEILADTDPKRENIQKLLKAGSCTYIYIQSMINHHLKAIEAKSDDE